MKNRSLHSVLTRFGIIAAILATLVLIAPAASADETVQYAENGTDPVATFSATDPEGDPITWKLEGAKGVDNADFEIGEDDGVLTFKSPPNYEVPTDRDEDGASAGEQGAKDKMYQVSITANGGTPFVLTVEVTDEDEPGSVSLDKPQPQVGRALKAIEFDDPDGTNEKSVAWSSGPSTEGPWTDLEVTNESYTPKAADAGNYLRVVFTYNDGFGDGKTAIAISDNLVEDKTLANARPKFEDDDASTEDGFQVARTSKEGAAKGSSIGAPVSATDDDNDILRYMIVAETTTDGAGVTTDVNDYAKFAIDAKTGQLMVDTVLDFEPAVDAGPIVEGQVYTLTVRVIDPSGASADADVRITLEDVNEPPVFDKASDGRTTVYIAENTVLTTVFNEKASVGADVDGDDGNNVTYVATDDDGDTDAVAYSLEGANKDLFGIVDGTLSKLATTAVDFEKKGSYSISVIATSTRGVDDEAVVMYDRVVVSVMVVNNNDGGEVSLSQREPQVGSSLAASVSDVDGEISNVDWQWYRLTAGDAVKEAITEPITIPDTVCVEKMVGTASCVILKATSASYTPTEFDLGDADDADGARYLAARATYNDKFNGDTKTMVDGVSDAPVQADDAANTAPEFKDQDRNVPGVQDEAVTREVLESAGAEENIGDEFTASDSNDDLLMYTLGGPDADSFGLSDPARMGDSINLQTKAALDFETKDEYTVTITAMDPSGASDMITVTVMVTDVNEGAAIDEVETVMYAENDTDPVATFSATDPEGDAITWKLAGAGVDNGKFAIGEDDGVLTFKDSPDYESAGDGDENPDSVISQGVEDNMYKVSVTANDGSAFALTVEVTDEDEPGSVSLDKPQPQVGRALKAIEFDDPDGTNEKSVAWSSGPSTEGPWTDLEVTNESYTPKAADAGNYLRVVFTYNDGFGDGKTAIAISDNVVEDKTLANARPKFEGDDASSTDAGFQVARKSKEGAAKGSSIGAPVSATDDDNDILRYMIVAETTTDGAGVTTDVNDYAKFAIDAKTGQLMVDTVLDFEPAVDAGPIVEGQVYTLTVRVIDPSGASADADVRITLEDVNEPPVFDKASDGRTTVYIAENTVLPTVFNEKASVGADVDGDGGTDVIYVATDDDGGPPADSVVAYSLEGANKDLFGIGDGTLSKLATTVVDFEKKGSYSITVLATTMRGDAPDEVKMYDRVVVSVMVVNGDDPGEVSLSQREPQVGSSLTVSVSDDDGDVGYVDWQWYRLTAGDAVKEAITEPITIPDTVCVEKMVGIASCVILKATSASYTPTEFDLGDADDADGARYLAARATYSDKFNAREAKTMADGVSDAPVQAIDAANTAPEFKDQDRDVPGVQDETVTREVAENTEAEKNVGQEFTATDGDNDRLMYTLGGPDAESFGLSDPARMGDSINLQTKAALDFETKDEYTVTITAMDPSGASDMITVTVMVTNVDDGATITLGPAENTAPTFADDAETDFMVYENMYVGAAVGMVMATDEDGDTLMYSDDSRYFDVDDMGNITTTMMLDHEAMASHIGDGHGVRRRGHGHHRRDDRGRGHVPGLHGRGQQRPDERL